MNELPFAFVKIFTGDIIYGGKVTSNWEHQYIQTILKVFCSENMLSPRYTFFESKLYYGPDFKRLDQYSSYVDNLPLVDNQEILNIDSNAYSELQVQTIRQQEFWYLRPFN